MFGWQGAIGKAKECVKMQGEGKMAESAVTNVVQRADVISCGTLAEITNFQKERCVDFKAVMTTFLRGQIDFYSKVGATAQCANLATCSICLSFQISFCQCDYELLPSMLLVFNKWLW